MQTAFDQIAKHLVGLGPDALRAVKRKLYAEARDNFWSFRLLQDPGMLRCWFQQDVADHLQDFYEELIAGKRPKLVLEAPPQHGKSRQVREFLAWLAGKVPDYKSMFTSYSDALGTETNVTIQRIMMGETFRSVFHKTRLAGVKSKEAIDDETYRRNTGVIEFVGNKGSFRNTTVHGQINGLGFHVGVVDDPIKGRSEASSKTVRDGTWRWLTDDFFARFDKMAGMIMIMTRWHREDPVGRFLEAFPNTKVLRYQAIADADDWTVECGYRKAGEPLFPEHKPLDFLNERRSAMTLASWASQYQQSPIVEGGNLFPVEKLKIINEIVRSEITYSVRYWDKAGTEGGSGARTAGVLMHRMKNKRWVVESVISGHWAAQVREDRIEQTAALDGKTVHIYVEQEPGSGGKESAENTVRRLAGYKAFADRVTGSKEVRAEPFAAQVQGGNVDILSGNWNKEYIDELEAFPAGKRKDMVDASSGAFNKLLEFQPGIMTVSRLRGLGT